MPTVKRFKCSWMCHMGANGFITNFGNDTEDADG